MKNTLTIGDIHELRYKNYEDIRDMTNEKIIERTKKSAKIGWERLEKLKAEKSVCTINT